MGKVGKKLLLTGSPGCGKTTAVMEIVETAGFECAVGFYTEEISRAGRREGFGYRRLDGVSGKLAHTNIRSKYRVSKYGVDVAGFEEAVVSYLEANIEAADVFVIDEIGKMECFSERFTAVTRHIFASDKDVLATVARKGSGFISEAKQLADEIYELRRDNREEIIEKVLESFGRI